MRGDEFLNLMSDMRGLRDTSRRKALQERLEIDPRMPLKRMSKGMKQKIGIIAAFMHDPACYILDEPTDGLDPLMQKRFVELILEEKRRGKTILLSSHQFDEIERTCDRAAILRAGKLAAMQDVASLKQTRRRKYLVTCTAAADAAALLGSGLPVKDLGGNRAEVTVSGSPNTFLRSLAHISVESLDAGELGLEEVFMQYYGQEAGQ